VISKAVKGPNAKAPIGSTKTGDSSWIPIDEELAGWGVVGQPLGARRAMLLDLSDSPSASAEAAWFTSEPSKSPLFVSGISSSTAIRSLPDVERIAQAAAEVPGRCEGVERGRIRGC
jgi:hypothetical protein